MLSVSVIADECARADGYATAMMVLGLDKSLILLNKLKGIDAYFIYSDSLGKFQTVYTEGFDDIILEN